MRIKIGVSSCLLGNQVRYDGGHKRDAFVVDELGQWCQLVAVCPELEVGMGVPRPPLHLEGDRMLVTQSGEDVTDRMRAWSEKRVKELARLRLDGYIFKKGSPSCGMVTSPGQGRGLFAEALMRHLPLLPVEDEERLRDAAVRDNFVERVHAHRRWRGLLQVPLLFHLIPELAEQTYMHV